ncbi:MAG: Na+/H+ antiporter NhaA [Confluentimicrobium sp.]|jgi:Na+:H+ antiporter, NhaA family|uniref:Na(+)/H(+) antiporter NhaA n=1 Tax=Actibacterium naphthalenivorans TaxID=1614693 RepID=A0A840CM75_9RHOB|nr:MULTISPECIES: Na+/H+ antiporter NhaA [Actibacterium]MBB4023836.1 NhaA family Na+:H+ antiporter [Actibacterium naphthalenivorans]MBC58773.1 Na+/H+ antiporter NhaA [Actibacterium sp.]MDY6858062.1 Na+/H+ antiporter NhaA [Pseudomonadota bacterium]|tara:strand:- start:8025 stop:9449 length:1425 start_codon:yes stop_codon:yes gene_type:complete
MSKSDLHASDDGLTLAPWEKSFRRIVTPFEQFLHRQTTSGLLLMGMAVLALVLANGPFAEAYDKILKTYVGIGFGDWTLKMSLHHWINDALMAFFFFVVGLELKREFLVGELANPRNAALPIAAAIGGMVVPALFYFALNPSGDAAAGWGIPMATDIAFAIGAMALLGTRAPKALVTFLVALAIVDDLGAVMVIAVFYTDSIALMPLFIAVLLFLVLLVLNRSGVRDPVPYFLVAVLLWYALLSSGVHATLAGVIGAMTVPAYPKYNPERFSAHVRALMDRFDASHRSGQNVMTNIELRSEVEALRNGVTLVEAPLQRLEQFWHMPVAFLVIPIFALANAGIAIDTGALGETLSNPVLMGVSLGLILGKFIGITGASWLAIRLGLAVLPSGTRFTQIAGASLLAGIGFTMSIFVAQLAFEGQDDLLLMAKTGILGASFLAGVTGFVWLYLVGNPTPDSEQQAEHRRPVQKQEMS